MGAMSCKTTYSLVQNGIGRGETRWGLQVTPECDCCGFTYDDLAPVGGLTIRDMAAQSGLSFADCWRLKNGERITL